jgi:phosphoglycolate phosphatase-like HAD superfamily hydrolase
MAIVFDFDGVICDTAFEAFRIALTTTGKIENPFSKEYDHLYQEFYSRRIHVGPAWNYYYVMQEMLNNVWEPWRDNNSSQNFSKDFFCVREEAQKNNIEWLKLNPIYDHIAQIISPHIITILTNKNKSPVEKLLKYYDIKFSEVISMPENVKFKSKVDLLNYKFKGQNIKFIDDHFGIVADVRSRATIKIDARHASWGYTKDKVPGLSLEMEDLKEWLKDV